MVVTDLLWIHKIKLTQLRNKINYIIYLRQGGYVIVVVCLLATVRKNVWADLHEIFREGWQCTNEQMIKFWWRSGSRIVTLVRHALAEVCTVPVLLVLLMTLSSDMKHLEQLWKDYNNSFSLHKTVLSRLLMALYKSEGQGKGSNVPWEQWMIWFGSTVCCEARMCQAIKTVYCQ